MNTLLSIVASVYACTDSKADECHSSHSRHIVTPNYHKTKNALLTKNVRARNKHASQA